MANLQPPLDMRLSDQELERVRRSHAGAIRELQALPAARMRVLPNVTLEDGVDTAIAHGLGRPPLWVKESSPRGGLSTGRVEEIRSAAYDRSSIVVLRATGWGATIGCDVVVL